MRYIYLLLITFIFAACGNQKLRFKRVNSTKQKVVELNDIPSIKIKPETAYIPETNREIPVTENETSDISDAKLDESSQEETLDLSEVVSSSFPKTVQDSTTVSDDEAQAIEREAIRADQLGKWSLGLSLFFFVFLLLGILATFIAFGTYSPVAIIISLAFAILALASLVVSIILGSKSLNAAYNTPKGRKRAIAGIVISSVVLGLLLVNLAFSLF